MNKEESFEDYIENIMETFPDLDQSHRRMMQKVGFYQAKKIEALEKENEELRWDGSLNKAEEEIRNLKKEKDSIARQFCSAKEASEMRTAQLIAALKKAEEAMFGACDKSLTVPEDIKEYRDSLEYQAIKHLLED